MNEYKVLRQATVGEVGLFRRYPGEEEIAVVKDDEIIAVKSLDDFFELWHLLNPEIQEAIQKVFPGFASDD